MPPGAAQAKSERLLNLVICLLVARSYLPKNRIRQVVHGYGEQADDAFERMFERDKEELRELGIPIETGESLDEPGYRIRRSDFELPTLTLEPDEAAVIGLAARVWQHAGLAAATSQALLKLRAAGVETDRSALSAVEPRVATEEPAFWPLWEAVRDRRPVRFGYRKPGASMVETRQVQPWAVMSWHGRWYTVGHDVDRAGTRLFRLSRVEGRVVTAGPPGSYDVPSRTAVRDAVAALAPPEATGTARMRVREGAGWGLRRRLTSTCAAGEGWEEISVPYADPGVLAEEVVTYGSDVVVLEPKAVRDAVIARLELVAGGQR